MRQKTDRCRGMKTVVIISSYFIRRDLILCDHSCLFLLVCSLVGKSLLQNQAAFIHLVFLKKHFFFFSPSHFLRKTERTRMIERCVDSTILAEFRTKLIYPNSTSCIQRKEQNAILKRCYWLWFPVGPCSLPVYYSGTCST